MKSTRKPTLNSTTPYVPQDDDDDDDDDEGKERRRVDPPKTPRLVLRPEAAGRTPPSPDTEENVARQTEGLYWNFLVEMNSRQCNVDGEGTSGTTDGPAAIVDSQLMADARVPSELLSPQERVGRQLAMIGDDVNARYANDFSKMVRLLRPNASTAYDGFANVARQLFSDGIVNWGRIIVLLCFGYRVVLQVAKTGVSTLFRKFFRFVVDFIVRENIARWIASQGGWVAALRYIPESVGWQTIGVVVSVAAVFVIAAVYLRRMN